MRLLKLLQHYYAPQYAVWVLAVVILAGLVSYVYFVQQAVVNVAERDTTENRVAALSSEIGEMEFQHLSLQRDVDLEYAHAQGFTESDDAVYVTRGDSRTLTLRAAQ